MTTRAYAPAGWYPDAHGEPQTRRYWDGSQWTEHTSNQAQQAPAAQQAMPQQHAQQPHQAAPQQQFPLLIVRQHPLHFFPKPWRMVMFENVAKLVNDYVIHCLFRR